MPPETSLIVGPAHATLAAGRSRVEVTLAGEPLWFESGDARLAPTIEGFATAILPSGLFNHRRLQIAEPVCATWRAGAARACELLQEWWRFPSLPPQADRLRTPSATAPSGVGLFFTGGVDSFYSLLTFPRRIDHLIYVVDYDVPPQAPQRYSRFEQRLRLIAEASGATAIVLRTNLRRHPLFAGPSWQQSHGAALLGAAHLLSGILGEVVMSSSYSRFHPRPWGSHWELDSLWSSAALQVTHFGEGLRRFDKLAAIVDSELVQRFVRPCWENPPHTLNCSVCEKCVRTQISIAACGDLTRFTAFDHSTSLGEKIDGLRHIGAPELIPIYADFMRLPSLAPVQSALARLIRRSRFSALRKTVRRELGRRLRGGRPCPTA